MYLDDLIVNSVTFVARPDGVVIAVCTGGAMLLPKQNLTVQRGAFGGAGASPLPGDFGNTLTAGNSYPLISGVEGVDPVSAVNVAGRFELQTGAA